MLRKSKFMCKTYQGSNTLMHNLLWCYISSSGIDDMLCTFVFSGFYSVVKHIVHEFAASCGWYFVMPLILHVKRLLICDQFVVTFWCSFCTYLSSCLSRPSHCIWLVVELKCSLIHIWHWYWHVLQSCFFIHYLTFYVTFSISLLLQCSLGCFIVVIQLYWLQHH